jgi:hypothetical protein
MLQQPLQQEVREQLCLRGAQLGRGAEAHPAQAEAARALRGTRLQLLLLRLLLSSTAQ